jgi:2'-5' RNA ligase
MKRLFVAIHIEPCEEFIDAFRVIREEMADERVKWVEEENLHLTLKFIGEVDDEMIRKIDFQLKTVPTMGGIDFSIEGVGLIRNLSDPRAIYANIKNRSTLETLNREIDSRLADIGIEAGTKSFLPHLTLGRIKFLRDKDLLKDILDDFRNTYFQKVSSKEFILFESILTPRGPIYKRISGYPV